MDERLNEALSVLQDHLEAWMAAPPERGSPMTKEEVEDALELLTVANLGGAVLLTRLAAAGVELHRQDKKNIDLWIVEQVRMGNIARAAAETYRSDQEAALQNAD